MIVGMLRDSGLRGACHLGQKESAVARVDFIDEARSEIEEIGNELEAAKKELLRLPLERQLNSD